MNYYTNDIDDELDPLIKEALEEIIDFVKDWFQEHDLSPGEHLSDDQMIDFVGQLQEQVGMMDYTLPERKLINYPCF